MALLLPTAPVVFEKRGCVTCHSQALPGELAAVARRKGIAVDEVLARKNQEEMLVFFTTAAEAAMQGDQPAGNFVTVGYVMAAFAAEKHPLDSITAAFTHLLAGQQMADGSWLGNGVSRPPMEDSIVSQTALAVRAMTLYPIPARKAEVGEKLRRARRFLLTAQPGTTEERNMRLMGLVWTKASSSDIQAAAHEIIGLQMSNGGWAQRDGFDPDAYATGESLYALHEAGISPGSEVYRKGVAFLLKTQYRNGAWFVKSRAYPTQLYFESGYPFGHNQWISAAGAAWASLAIAQTLPDAKR